MPVRIGITLGDITGIGPEIVARALDQWTGDQDVQWCVIGDARVLEFWRRRLQCRFKFDSNNAAPEGPVVGFRSVPGIEPPLDLPCGSPEAARGAVAWLREGARLCLNGQLDALVTAPVNKAAIVPSGIPFIGQTELLASIAQTDEYAMMLLGHDDRDRWLRVVLTTIHVPIARVADQIDLPAVQRAIRIAVRACRQLELPRARVGVCGLNPHAGEHGVLGDEEQHIIEPAIRAAVAQGLDVHGPFAADTLFHHAYRGDYDAIVAMYHDQGLAPLKMVAFDHGVNWTVGLPFVRVSPDHGTAYDIAGQGRANPSSMIAAMRLAQALARGPTVQIG